MYKQSKRICWLATGMLLALGSAPLAWADDTELFIANADPQVTGARPNILFIIDTSGSMRSTVLTQQAWDPNLTFSDCYKSNALYFSTTGSKPSCGSSNYIWKSSNACAASQAPLANFGRYDGNLLQWRNRKGTSQDRWIALSNKRRSAPLECQADAGVHGNGGSATYAADGAAGPWSTSNAAEPAWTQNYTIWDGNWLNWFRSGGTVQSTRIQVVKDVATNLLQNINGVNVGLMRFSDYRGWGTGEEGGPVIYAMENIATARSNIINMVNNLPANSWTPLSETLYEAGQYFMGRNVDYGNRWPPPYSVANSRVGNTLSSNTYQSPLEFQCQKNYIVYLTDGAPTRDSSANNKIESLPGFAQVNTTGGKCDLNGVNGQGHCLDDMAEYLHLADLDPQMPGQQNVTTYTIGFTVDLPLLASTAARGGGEYRLADDTASLAGVLTDIVSSILKEAQTFTAPAVPVNAFNRTKNLDDVYVSVFEPSGHSHWTGNVKKYKIQGGKLVGQDGKPAVNPNTGFFWNDAGNVAFSYWSDAPDGDRVAEGGAANQLPFYTNRVLYTNLTGSANVPLAVAASNRIIVNDPELQPQDFGLAAGDVTVMDKVIAWTLGLDIWAYDEAVANGNSNPPLQPRNAMGDPLHVRPVAVIYGGTAQAVDATIFVSTNDGVLHAVDAQTGVEDWSFIPKRLLPRQYELYLDPLVANKRYGLDGEITAYVRNNNLVPGIQAADGEEAWLVFGMRRGGDALYAMNVTDPNAPVLAWVIDSNSPGFSDLGQTWSRPTVARVNIDGTVKDVVIIGGGYDTKQDTGGYKTDTVGNAIYMIDLDTGQKLWSAGASSNHDLRLDGSSNGYAMEHSIPAPVRVLDLSGDGLADRMYVGDMGGRLWRFDIINGQPASTLVEGGLLATLGAADLTGNGSPADQRRFYSAPDVVAVLDAEIPYLAVNIGSGYRAHPLDSSVQDEFYSVRDFSMFDVIPTDGYPAPITRADLVDVTSWGTAAYPTLLADDKGWLISMVQSPGEKILSESITFDNTTFFTSFAPGSSGSACSTAAGTNRVYQVSVRDGRPRVYDNPYPPQTPPQPEDRITTLKQGGIAPETILLFTEDGDGPTACSGVECFDPNFDGSTVRTFWFEDETR
ncbi:MAG: hypothetical protein D6727_08140 [Gammaproteobacteria bacterium]|nr:MAG: hypothetical protein D6727_08140 [Gammaproteobacteria bacterium]